MKLRLAVVYGSKSCEHDVSIISALQAAGNIDRQQYDVIYVYIDKNGDWYTGWRLEDIKLYTDFDKHAATRVIPMGANGKLRLIKHPDDKLLPFGTLKTVAEADVVMPVLHGMNGEDGTLQGMLEMWNVPYTSSGVLGSSVGMDKIAMKRIFRDTGLPVLPDDCVERTEWKNAKQTVLKRINGNLCFPVYVKPANLGSSIGINRADDIDGLEDAIDIAMSYDRRVLIENGITDLMEINCAVLGYGDEVQASVTEMPVRWTDFLSFEEKYLRGGGAKGAKTGGSKCASTKGMAGLNRCMPAPIGEELTKTVEELAKAAFKALDCKGVARVDFLFDKNTQKLYVGEINTIPGSLAFYLWEGKGITFTELINKMVEYAFKANADRNENVFSYQSAILSGKGGAKGGKLG